MGSHTISEIIVKGEKKMNINQFHKLEGKNVCFKALSTNDAQEIHDYASDEEVSRFIGWKLMNTLNETSLFIEEMLRRESVGTHLYASVVLKSTLEVIGTVMIFNFDKEANQAEVGYVFHREHWGKGYGRESLKLVSDFAFESLKLHKLHASVVDANIASCLILQKNGYKLEGRLKDHYFIEDKYYDSLLFGKIEDK
jgi:ribosomal-protein-alanine N-acetyltransferase